MDLKSQKPGFWGFRDWVFLIFSATVSAKMLGGGETNTLKFTVEPNSEDNWEVWFGLSLAPLLSLIYENRGSQQP